MNRSRKRKPVQVDQAAVERYYAFMASGQNPSLGRPEPRTQDDLCEHQSMQAGNGEPDRPDDQTDDD